MSRNAAVYDPANDPWLVPRHSPQVEQILATVTDKNEQIDAICKARGIGRVNAELRDILDSCLDGNVSISQTVDVLASPIEESYTSDDHGYLLWEVEATARRQRPLCNQDEILEFCGEPVAMCEPDPAKRPQRTLEGQLWILYFGIIHAARKQDRAAEDGRMAALVKLVQALQARSNPPLPENATPALHKHWIYSAGALWSDSCMLGPSAAESYDDSPGGTMGFTDAETRAWENENAFFARLTALGTADFMVYGVRAMCDALEGGIARQNQVRMTQEFEATWIDITLGVIVVWLEIAGEEMLARVRHLKETEEREVVMENGMSKEWGSEPTAARWAFWKMRLAKHVRDDARSEAAGAAASRALERMAQIEDLFSWS